MKDERLPELDAGRSPVAGPAVVAVGNFDGVHLGHQQTLRLARREAERRRAEFVAVTFDPHPSRLLYPRRAPRPITPLAIRAERLAAAGVERLVVVEFSEAIARLTPAEFVERLLVERLAAVCLVQGGNFRFGRGRSGDLDTLRRLGARHGFAVIESPAVERDGAVVSSTRIRGLLEVGDLDLATALLGGLYEIEGAVEPGDGRGRSLGFPTANLAGFGDLLLPPGVYAAVGAPAGAATDYRAVVHHGPRPTFASTDSLEAHLIGFSGEVSRLRLGFLAFLRGIETWSGPGALRRQLERDVARARALPDPWLPPETLSVPPEAVLATG